MKRNVLAIDSTLFLKTICGLLKMVGPLENERRREPDIPVFDAKTKALGVSFRATRNL